MINSYNYSHIPVFNMIHLPTKVYANEMWNLEFIPKCHTIKSVNVRFHRLQVQCNIANEMFVNIQIYTFLNKCHLLNLTICKIFIHMSYWYWISSIWVSISYGLETLLSICKTLQHSTFPKEKCLIMGLTGMRSSPDIKFSCFMCM